ncbi:MAG: metalloregulator ArsR/SmtB family transcription factor [bacterium]
MDETVEILRAMGEESRLRILILLEQAGELSVADIGHALELAQPKVSRHLGRLRLAGWVKERRWRGFALYRIVLAPGNLNREYLIQIMGELENDPIVAADMQRLVALRRARAKQPIEPEAVGGGESAE